MRVEPRLINLDGVELPVGFLELLRVFSNKGVAALERIVGVTHGTTLLAIDSTGPVTTEIGVEYQLLCREVFTKVAGSLEMRHGSPKVSRVRCAVGDRLGD